MLAASYGPWSPSAGSVVAASLQQVGDDVEQSRRARAAAGRLRVHLWGAEEQRRNIAVASESCRELLERQGLHMREQEEELTALRVAHDRVAAHFEAAESRAALVEPLEERVAELRHKLRASEAQELRLSPAAGVAEERQARLFNLSQAHEEMAARLAVAEEQEARVPSLLQRTEEMQRRIRKLQEGRDRMNHLEKSNADLRMKLKVAEKRLQLVDARPGGAGGGSRAAAVPTRRASPTTAAAKTGRSEAPKAALPAGDMASVMAENAELRNELLKVTLLLEDMVGLDRNALAP
eukprot:TRINITY_DN63103_c0_g1_i1.p1 TRINITY_DN63103_c0_g1~~TRINITY_DN63103_c0_g1_i1.p1  ORF type:complete len:294 (-),score=89.18 TRINITY_DN63103_c0_g1_i1:189-1070(-)